jgi:uncharacterized protein (TIGR02118 family)
MIVFTVMYPNEPGKRFDMDYYCNKHLAMAREKIGDALKGVSVERGLSGAAPGSPAEYAVVCHLQFDCMEDLQNYLAPHSPAFDADVPNFTDITPRFQINEVVES